MGKKIIFLVVGLFVFFGWLGWYWQNNEMAFSQSVNDTARISNPRVAGWYGVYDPKPTIRTQVPSNSIELKLYFDNLNLDGEWPDLGCDKVYPVTRAFNITDSLEKDVLLSLLRGTIKTEENRSYKSSIESDVKLISFDIQKGIAILKFDRKLNQMNNCQRSKARLQIQNSLLQFPSIKFVEILTEE